MLMPQFPLISGPNSNVPNYPPSSGTESNEGSCMAFGCYASLVGQPERK